MASRNRAKAHHDGKRLTGSTATQAALPVLKSAGGDHRTLDARPDTPDFRDKLYEATLVEVPPLWPLQDYLKLRVPILNQGQEGACTGFGLATVANYLLRKRRVKPDKTSVSPRMIYEMARRYDEWPGEDYSGSSARGAMKGWHKHGICAESKWQYDANNPQGTLDHGRAADATKRPLGAYYRVNHQDLVCMHSALTEVGILYATSKVHDGWRKPKSDGTIVRTENLIGGHAFAIVAYDHEGFWIQNSWGKTWGKQGFGHVSYDDWLANGTDVWVARLGAPVALAT
ncbi:MAG TPA: C1 family peptidase, partial [Tepidisphaeraceae bacterium]